VKAIFVFPRAERAHVPINARGVSARLCPAPACAQPALGGGKTVSAFGKTVTVFRQTVSVLHEIENKK